MKLAVLTFAAAAALGACAEKSDKPKTAKSRPTTGSAAGSTAGSAEKKPTGTAGGSATAAAPTTGTVTLDEAKPKLTASITPIADKIQEAMMHGCMEGADRVAALFRDADDAADDLHVMMRDPALRAQLADAIKARQDKEIAKAMSRIDTALVACPQAFEQAKKGMDRLLQPAIAVPQ